MRVQLERLEEGLIRMLLRGDRDTRLRIFFNLASYLDMQTPLSAALDQLWVNESDDGARPNGTVARAVAAWRSGVRGRSEGLAEAMKGWIPERDRMVIRAGESASALSTALKAARMIDASADEMKRAIGKAVAYPVALMLILSGVLWVFGVQLFTPLRASAPKALLSGNLQLLMSVSDALQVGAVPAVAVVVVLAIAAAISLPRLTGPWRVRLERLPPWSWYKLWYESAFLLSMAALLKAKVSPKAAIEDLMDGASPWMAERLRAIWRGVRDGDGLGWAIVSSPFDFPERSIGRDIRALEGRADLGQMLEEITIGWMTMKARRLERTAAVVKNLGLAFAGLVIGFTLMSVASIAQSAAQMGRNF